MVHEILTLISTQLKNPFNTALTLTEWESLYEYISDLLLLITDLSSPTGASVNDGVETEVTSLSYITVDNVAQVAGDLGRGALLAKVDIESTYRLIPVHPSDRPLQAITWEGNI